MKREFMTTGDGSKTIHLPEWDEQYHSKHGAIQEALHVFIQEGLLHFRSTYPFCPIEILEIGFGTGLNALLTWKEATSGDYLVHYTGIEAYPIGPDEVSQLNYADLVQVPEATFYEMHNADWQKEVSISTNFVLQKEKIRFEELNFRPTFHLIYYDAFGARVQPELWTESLFQKMFDALKTPGVLVTYAAKGSVRRALQTVGFKVERLPGPPGKREMLRATKS